MEETEDNLKILLWDKVQQLHEANALVSTYLPLHQLTNNARVTSETDFKSMARAMYHQHIIEAEYNLLQLEVFPGKLPYNADELRMTIKDNTDKLKSVNES